MGKAYEKGVAAAQAAQAAAAQPEPEQMSAAAIESFIKGFGVSAAAVRQIRNRWIEDQQVARDAGWESHADSVWYDA